MRDPALSRGETPINAVLDRLRAKRESALPTRIPRISRDRASFPLSDSQERLWLIDQLQPGNTAYNITVTVKFEGSLKPSALDLALAEIVGRHEALRTTFHTENGAPAQVVAPAELAQDSLLRRVDLSRLAVTGPEVERLAHEEAEAPFDLARGPLLRLGLLRISPEEHILLLTLHHIVGDGWSMRVLLHETRILYHAFLESRPSPLPELTLQYVDFADWQHRWLGSASAARQMAYWKQQLEEHQPILQMPTDRPRPLAQTMRGRTHRLVLSLELSQRVNTLSRNSGVTSFVVLLATFETLLHRLSGQLEILIGFPIANRKRVEIQDLIGFFANTLVLRADFPAGASFQNLLGRLHEAALSAYDHQELPFGRLIKELQPERHLSHSPLFQAAFVYQNMEAPEWELSGLLLTPCNFNRHTSMFDLTLVLKDGPEGLEGELEYSTDLFDATTMARYAAHLEVLLAAVTQDPTREISHLPLLSAAEEHLVLSANDTAVDYARGSCCLHELIEEQAERTPDAVAVAAPGESLSYAGLMRWADRLAGHLARLGVGPEVRVGVCLERSLEMVAGLLAILKAGGAYVPLDPSYPKERLAYMLEDSAVPVLLAQATTGSVLPDLAEKGTRLVCLDREYRLPTAAGVGQPVRPDNLAYVIYTSGSTGRPKGVMNSHRAIVNRLLWMQAQYGLTAADRVLQKTPVSFDVSVWELFWPLLTGACLIMARPGGHRDGGYLVRTIEEQAITTLHFVPSMLAIFLETPEVERCVALKRVIASGEALSHGLMERHFTRLEAPLHNLYGPTEAAVDVTFWACDPGDRRGLVPIGRPVANTTIELLDRNLHPVPLGVAGQLHIGGVQLARGYLGRPELTAERFLPDPSSAGGRLYATGDLARRLPAGEIDYLGRIDHQVKVRGFRIELGEIEMVLRCHPGAGEVVVVARGGEAASADASRLAAYVVPDAAWTSRELLVADLRRLAREKLPDFMVPADFVVLAALPLSPSGKVDRRGLPAPGRRPERGREIVPPLNLTEEILMAIWAEVLGMEEIGAHDNFFDLGGHSLRANQVVSRVRDTFRMELPLRSFFAAPTVASLAKLIEEAGRGMAGSPTPPLLARRERGSEPLSFAQQRLWFLNQLDHESTAYHIPVALRLEGVLSPAALASALDGVVRRHEALRTTFELRPDGPVQVIAPPAGWSLPIVDLSWLGAARGDAADTAQTEMRRLILAEANRRFDLAHGPLLRTSLLRLGTENHVLLLVIHHIVSDAWGMVILWREMMTLYRAATDHRPSGEAVLPELPIQYGDFAAWQRAWFAGEVLASELAYWRQQLAGAPALLELPTDRPRPPVQSFRGERHRFSLPSAPARNLKALGRREGTTLFMVLLATFDVLLARYSRQEDIVVGAPIAGRNRVETEWLIGLFLNTLALRVDTSTPRSWRALLRQVREVTLAGYAHQELPFERLVAELDLERNLAYAPIFQALLVFQNTPVAKVDVPGLTLCVLDMGTGTAKFDLILNLEETAEGLAGWWLYSRDLFDSSTVARMLRHFQVLIAGILADPELPIPELPILDTTERHQLLTAWNDTVLDLPLDRPFTELFEAQAERLPMACAVTWEEQELSYGDLNCRANRLARGLVAAGVGPEMLVTVLAERGAGLLIAMLAIWKAGGVYLPLDPHHPVPRLLQTLEQSGSRYLLVSDGFLATAAEIGKPGCRALALAELLRDEQPGANLSLRALPTHLAYVIFTSGSTGVPKGVMIEQRSMLNHLSAKIMDLGLTAADRVAQTALQTFDISIWQFLAALLVGGSVHIVSDEVVRDPLRLLGEIERRAITIFETVPSLLTTLLQVGADHRPALSALRWLIPTGEALPHELCRQWFAVYPAVPLVNAYGPTECSDDVTHRILREPLLAGRARTPIGRPVANTGLQILSSGFHPAPIGVPGELAVGGVQVGRGYWRRPELTADRFIPDLFSAAPGGRLYRTGDLARWQPNGEVEFLGRIDHQVKVRGFRIELGDIEAILAQHPAVRETVVLAREDRQDRSGPMDRRLVAYVVADEGAALALPDLRAFLLEHLPEYMIPAAFVVLPAMPLTPNGKVDRKALPAPEAGGSREPRGVVAPRTDLERSLAGLWAEILGIGPGQVGVHDPFFEIGGNSILGAVLVNRLQKTLGEIVHVVALFDHPTVSGLAAYLLRDYPVAVARIWGLAAEEQALASGRIDAVRVAELRAIIPPRRPIVPHQAAEKNSPALFLLSAPRSGSTLLRVMLAGHPRLFSPPELELLSFDDLAERRAAFTGRNAFWLEGLIRAVMEIHRCDPERARQLVERAEAEALPTRLFYRRMQDWIGDRILVDKSPSYSLNRSALDHAEADFDQTRYIHLIRDPRAAIHSFEEAKLDQVFFRHTHSFTRRELAELIWVVSHQNIVQFLAAVPRERQHWVHFEDLVRDPQKTLEAICDFLGLPYHPDMAHPYKDVGTRMADGIHTESRMLGDVKFHEHAGVDANAAERWRRRLPDLPLGEPTHELAATLGYATRPPTVLIPSHPALVPLTSGGRERPLFLIHPVGGGVYWYLALAHQMGERPVYGLRATVESASPDLQALAKRYLEALREVQGVGPYLLGGWSMGAVVAYEMAQQLHNTGTEVELLALIDPPPPRATPAGEEDEVTLLGSLVRDLEGLSGKSLGGTEGLAGLTPGALPRVLAACQAAGVLPAEIDLDQFRELFTIFQQNRNALWNYVPGPYPGALSLLLARGPAQGTEPTATDPSLAWRELALGGADVHLLPADHYSLLKAPAVEQLARRLRSSLGRAAQREASLTRHQA
jgi:amino acid adenylation domain-containing protein